MWAHVRAEAPSGERFEAWRCTQPGCGRLRFGANHPSRCHHYVEPRPPKALPRA